MKCKQVQIRHCIHFQIFQYTYIQNQMVTCLSIVLLFYEVTKEE